jgi:hypothetical protein
MRLTNNSINEICNMKSLFIKSGGENSIIRLKFRKTPIILKVLEFKENQFEVFDGIEIKNFYFDINKNNVILRIGSIILVESILLKKNKNNEIFEFIIIGYIPITVEEIKLKTSKLKIIENYDSRKKCCQQTLEGLRPNISFFSIQLKLVNKIPIKEIYCRKKKINFIKFLFTDGSFYIECKAYGDEALKYEKDLEQQSYYLIENPHVEVANNSYRTWNTLSNLLKFDIIIKSHTKIKKILFSSINLKNDHFSQKEYLIEHFNEKPCFELPAKRKVINQLNEINANNENQLIHKKKKTDNNFNPVWENLIDFYFCDITPIIELNLKINNFTDVLGIVISISPIKEINKKLKILDIILMDETKSIKCGIWGEDAKNFRYRNGDILLFKGILVSYYKGLTLSAYKKTRIKLINPRDHKENKNVQDLNDWRIKYFKN